MKARFVVLWALALLVCAFGVHADGNESVDQCACQQQCCGCSYDCADQFYYDCCGDCFCAGCVEFNSRYTYRMLSHVENLRKERVLLHAKRCGDIEPCRLYSGFSLIAIADYQHSNRTSKFGYLMRHPTSSNQIGKDVTEAVLHSMQFQFTGALCNWITVFGEYVYYPEQSFGAGTITTVTRNLTEGRKGYVLLGDLNCFPVYAAIGKMDTPFGQMFSVNPFTSSTMWHAFGGLAYGALLGYDCNGINASLMAVQGGAQFRAHNTPVFGTAVPSRLTNWVADFNYSFELCDICAQVGASYTRSSAYVQNFPVQHFNSGDRNNPAWTAYGQLRWCDWVLKGSFAQTTRVWPGTHNPNAPLDVFAAHKVSSFDVGAKWTFYECDCWKYAASGEFSTFIAGPDGAPWERQNQTVGGLSAMYNESSKFFVEGFHTKGFAPLNFISGGNLGAGETISDAGASSMGFVIGAQITL